MKKDNNILKLGHDTISRDPFPNSKKVYIKGSIYPNINVGMREIEISESDNFFSTNPKNNSAFILLTIPVGHIQITILI